MERINKHKLLPNLTNTKTRSPLQDLNRPLIHRTTTKTSLNHPLPCTVTSSSKIRFDSNPKSISKSKSTELTALKSKPRSESKNNDLIAPKSKSLSSRSQSKNNDYGCQTGNPRLQKKKGSRMSNLGKKPLIPSLVKLVPGNANLLSSEKCTPVGKVAAASVHDDDVNPSVGEEVDKVRTPPVEASVSPEIQFGSHSKILASKSGATPVCYGAGHLLSGVADRRKCRRRGSLKGGFEKPNMALDYRSIDGDRDLGHEISIPMPAGASVRWHLSPHDEKSKESSDLGRKLMLSSDLVCDLVNYSGIGSAASKMDETVNILDYCQDLEVNHGVDEQFLATPDSFELSTGSLSSGNMIETPNSDLSSDRFLGGLEVEINKTDIIESDLNSLTSMWGAPDFGDTDLPSDSVELAKVQKNRDCVSSWVSDASLGNLGLSEMRISWRDSLEIERDEFDCCRCLSDDEEIDAKCGAIVEKNLDIDDDDLSPEILDYEPIISEKQKGKVSPHLTNNTCAESICTNGSSLFASGDSDWTGCLSNNNYIKFSTHNQTSGARM